MRKLIYKLFFVVGICASALGFNPSANAAVSPTSIDTTPSLKATESGEKLYFTDAVTGGGNAQLYTVQHYSHSSHQSHQSHQSHYSHRSGY
jgi:hypothetical protein